MFFLSYKVGIAKNSKNIKETVLNVKLIDKNLDKKTVPIIKVQISSYPFGGVEFLKSIDSIYEQVAVKDGNVFNVFSSRDILYMYVYYEGQRVPGGLYYWIDNIYIIKAGSKLTIELDNNDVKFYGEGSVVPNIQSQIIKHGYETSSSNRKLLNDKKYLEYFKKTDNNLDSTLQLQLSIISKNKNILGDYYTQLLIANCYGYRYFSQLRAYDFELMQNEVYFNEFKKYFNENMNRRYFPKFGNDVLNASPIFANYLIEEFNILERISHEKYGPMLPDSCIRKVLQKIKTESNGVFRDKLLTLFAIRVNKNENATIFFSEILNTIKNENYKDLLVNKIKLKRNNLPFRDFKLQNESGEIYTLESFKNKVVVLDFWFSGCENCIVLNELMKPIVRHFSNNPNIKFVSISIDKSKLQWLRSVETGNYTNHFGIHLYTNGEGSVHDLIKFYNITNYPTVFVIKDGIMISSLPPRPSRMIEPGQKFSKEGSRLIELLEKAIKL